MDQTLRELAKDCHAPVHGWLYIILSDVKFPASLLARRIKKTIKHSNVSVFDAFDESLSVMREWNGYRDDEVSVLLLKGRAVPPYHGTMFHRASFVVEVLPSENSYALDVPYRYVKDRLIVRPRSYIVSTQSLLQYV